MMSRLFALAALSVLAAAGVSAQTTSPCDAAGALYNIPTSDAKNQYNLVQSVVERALFGISTVNLTQTTNIPGSVVLASSPNGVQQLTVSQTGNWNFGTGINSRTFTIGVSGLTTGATIVGMDRRYVSQTVNGNADVNAMYFLDNQGQLYLGDIDTVIAGSTFVTPTADLELFKVGTSGVFTAASPAVGAGSAGVDMDFNPQADAIRIVQGTQNFRLTVNGSLPSNCGNPDCTTSGGTFSYAAGQNYTQAPNIATTAYSNAFANRSQNSPNTTQFLLDTNNGGVLCRASSPNDGTLVGVGSLNLGFTIDPVYTSMDYVTVPNTDETNVNGRSLFAVIRRLGGDSGSGIYRIDLNNGNATLITNLVPGSAPVTAMAFTTASARTEPRYVTYSGLQGILVQGRNNRAFFDGTVKYRVPASSTPDYITNTAAAGELVNKLTRWFGSSLALNCATSGQANFPAANTISMNAVHQNMNITKDVFNYFNSQVAASARSFGVPESIVGTVEQVLSTYSRNFVNPEKTICSASDCIPILAPTQSPTQGPNAASTASLSFGAAAVAAIVAFFA